MKKYTYPSIIPKQSEKFTLFAFCAQASDVLDFAHIDRIGREKDGSLRGFQRPQVANHIKEIRNYLSQDDAVLPNSIVVAFTAGVTVDKNTDGSAQITISADDNQKGFIVDGQQRLTALQGLPDKDFEVFVTGILCSNEEELRKQFILINNTKPLPKPLIYELLPTVTGLPHRLSSRAKAASLVEELNYDETSSLHGQINQHTNPEGIIRDTAIQKVVMNSVSDGAFRELSRGEDAGLKQFKLLSNFYEAVQETFPKAWIDQKPRTSRLIHAAGIVSMGYVMEYIYSMTRSIDKKVYLDYLSKLKGKCAWTESYWEFGEDNRRPWNSIQFVARDYMELTQYLIRILKK